MASLQSKNPPLEDGDVVAFPVTVETRGAYRPDIDGLRAVAVLIVLFFHTGISPLRGGFIGVDIFFVISGFLISRLISEEIAAGRFSIARFYERRVRRIFPALIVTVALTLLIAPLLLFPVEMRTTALTGVTALSSFSNLYLLTSAGYFAADAASQPLIHTWSLGVEEQLYLVFPLMLGAMAGWGRVSVAWMIVAVTLVSLGGCVIISYANRDFAYYFPLTRAWELLFGALLVYVPVPRLPRLLREVVAAGSLVVILATAYKFHPGLAFPGFWAVFPCAAAAALIAVGGQGGSLVSRLLATGPAVWIGKISYSLYLWHWPILVYYLLCSGKALSIGEGCLLVLASIAAAFLSWRFVEQPFRKKSVLATRGRLWLGAALSYAAVCIGAGLFFYQATHLPQPLSETNRLASYLAYDDTPVYRRGQCFYIGYINGLKDYDRAACLTPSTTQPNVLVVGDSHGAHMWSGLDAVMTGAHVMQATASGCKPVINPAGERGCTDLMHMVFDDFIRQHRPDLLILSARWVDSDIPDVIRTVEALKQAGQRVVVFGPIVEYERPLPRLLAQIADGRDQGLLISGRKPEQANTDRLMAKAVKNAGATYVSPYDFLCKSADAACKTLENSVPVQWDYGHLTAEGSHFIAAQALRTGAIDLTKQPPATK